MRNYEVAYIADPELDSEALSALEDKVKDWIKATGGKTLGVDRWGKRRLAYPISKRTDGFYFFIQAELPSNAGPMLERDMGLNEQILRYMITREKAE